MIGRRHRRGASREAMLAKKRVSKKRQKAVERI